MACSARDSPWSADAAALHFYRLNCNGKPVFFVLSISDLFEMRLKGFPLGTHRDLLGFSTIEYCVSLSSLLEWAPLFEMNFFFIKKKRNSRTSFAWLWQISSDNQSALGKMAGRWPAVHWMPSQSQWEEAEGSAERWRAAADDAGTVWLTNFRATVDRNATKDALD